MKLNKTALATTLSAAFLIPLSASIATAQTSKAENAQTLQVADIQGKHRYKRMHKGSHSHDGFRKILRGLDLTREQRDKIFKIRHAAVPTVRSSKQAMNALKQQLQAQATANDYDATLVNKLTQQIGQLTSQMASDRIGNMRKIYAVLTPEQRVQLRKNMAESKPRHGHRARQHRRG